MSRRSLLLALAATLLLSGCTGSAGKDLNQASSPDLKTVGGLPTGVISKSSLSCNGGGAGGSGANFTGGYVLAAASFFHEESP